MLRFLASEPPGSRCRATGRAPGARSSESRASGKSPAICAPTPAGEGAFDRPASSPAPSSPRALRARAARPPARPWRNATRARPPSAWDIRGASSSCGRGRGLAEERPGPIVVAHPERHEPGESRHGPEDVSPAPLEEPRSAPIAVFGTAASRSRADKRVRQPEASSVRPAPTNHAMAATNSSERASRRSRASPAFCPVSRGESSSASSSRDVADAESIPRTVAGRVLRRHARPGLSPSRRRSLAPARDNAPGTFDTPMTEGYHCGDRRARPTVAGRPNAGIHAHWDRQYDRGHRHRGFPGGAGVGERVHPFGLVRSARFWERGAVLGQRGR